MRRRHFMRGASALLALLAAGTLTSRARACRCLEPSSPAAAYRAAHAAFVGRVIGVAPQAEPQAAEVTLEVSRAWKADLPHILQVSAGAVCAFPLAIGSSYLLFLSRDASGAYFTERCMGNRPLADAASFIAWLGKNGRAGKVTDMSGR